MIRVTVELVSAVHPSRDRVLGIAHLTNEDVGVYRLKLSKWAPRTTETWKAGRVGVAGDDLNHLMIDEEVRGFDHVRRGVWDLLYLALRQVVGSRNP